MNHSPIQPDLSQFQIVKDLIDRQDQVLAELDELNARIEAFIKEVNEERKAEIQAENSGEEFHLRESGTLESGTLESVKKAA